MSYFSYNNLNETNQAHFYFRIVWNREVFLIASFVWSSINCLNYLFNTMLCPLRRLGQSVYLLFLWWPREKLYSPILYYFLEQLFVFLQGFVFMIKACVDHFDDCVNVRSSFCKRYYQNSIIIEFINSLQKLIVCIKYIFQASSIWALWS